MKLRKYFDFTTFFSMLLFSLLTTFSNAYYTGVIHLGSPVSFFESAIINTQAENMLALYRAPSHDLLNKMLIRLYKKRNIRAYLLDSKGSILGMHPIPIEVLELSKKIKTSGISNQTFIHNKFIVSHLVTTDNNQSVRLAVDIKTFEKSEPRQQLVKLFRIRIVSAFFLAVIFSIASTIFIKYRIAKSFPLIDDISKGDFVNKKNDLSDIPGVETLATKLQEMSKKLHAIMGSKNRLLIDISHELRSPLSRQEIAIDLARIKLNDLPASYLDRIEIENHKLQALISEIMIFSKENRSDYHLQIETLSLSELIQDILNDGQFEFPNTVITFTPEKDCLTSCDPLLMHRALENIIRNALKHANKEKPEIMIKLIEHENQYQIEINDNGNGVLEHNIEQIFAPFYRENRQNDMRKSGYGIGLSIAKKIIEAHHGSIKATNQDSSGLRITILLPKHRNYSATSGKQPSLA